MTIAGPKELERRSIRHDLWNYLITELTLSNSNPVGPLDSAPVSLRICEVSEKVKRESEEYHDAYSHLAFAE
jgi:hypothetical protein